MASPFTITISQEEFLMFYNIHRELYKILVIDLSRDLTESMQLLALWLWLERVGYRNVVYKILSSSYTSINELADEGITCLNCINSSMIHLFFEDDDIPHMRSLMDKEISLQILYKNKALAIRGVATILQDVCVRALGDIMQQVNMRNSSESMVENQKVVITSSKDHNCSNTMKCSEIGLDEAKNRLNEVDIFDGI